MSQVKRKVASNQNYFRSPAAEFIYTRTYSRWLDSEGRRENWPETVDRFVSFIQKERGEKIPTKVLSKIREKLITLDVMPSMRALWAAGSAAASDNTTMYNCAFQAVSSPDAFAEALYILMCGTGYGFSVEKKYVDQLPLVPKMKPLGAGVFVIEDSKVGWADSVKALVAALYDGVEVQFDYNRVRPQGARLKTMGGRASGPLPLMNLHNFIRGVFRKAQGRKLTSLECHDIMNMIAEVVVVGGVRRSSQISLSDLHDEEMRNAKVGAFPGWRYMANNSATYHEKPDAVTFLKEWSALAASGTGERGIFNRASSVAMAPRRRQSELIVGTNPCAEIQLRSMEFCNLSEVVVRADDDLDDLLEKVETATWLGVIQSTFTYFPYLHEAWQKNCNEERLLGVSLTGQMDNPEILSPDALKALKAKVLKVARRAAEAMGVPMPAATTCVKPSGTVSQLVDSASGLHPRYSEYYIRRYRIASIDPLFRMLQAQDVPMSPENGQRRKDWDRAASLDEQGLDPLDVCRIYERGAHWTEDKVNTWVVSFPVAAPPKALVRDDMTALDQLEWYKRIQTNWCEHNASITVYVKEEEWFEVGNWVYKNWDIVNGVSFLPHDGGRYEQTPYEEITRDEYEKLLKKFPVIDYTQLGKFEKEDNTQGSQALACQGGVCELN
jgi:ribonucleoside-triphosphate reductase